MFVHYMATRRIQILMFNSYARTKLIQKTKLFHRTPVRLISFRKTNAYSRIHPFVELGARLPEKIEAAAIADPPSDAPNLAPEPVFDKNVHKTVRNPSKRVRQPRPIDKTPVNTRKTGETDCSSKECVVFHGIGMRGLVAAQHVQLFLRDFTGSHRIVAVLIEIMSRGFVVIDAVPLL